MTNKQVWCSYIAVLVVCTIVGAHNTKDLGVTRQVEPVSKTELCTLADGNYILQTDTNVVWCSLMGKEVKALSVCKDCVKIIKDKENKVYHYKGTHRSRILGVYTLKEDVNVYEIHTDKPVAYKQSTNKLEETS